MSDSTNLYFRERRIRQFTVSQPYICLNSLQIYSDDKSEAISEIVLACDNEFSMDHGVDNQPVQKYEAENTDNESPLFSQNINVELQIFPRLLTLIFFLEALSGIFMVAFYDTEQKERVVHSADTQDFITDFKVIGKYQPVSNTFNKLTLDEIQYLKFVGQMSPQQTANKSKYYKLAQSIFYFVTIICLDFVKCTKIRQITKFCVISRFYDILKANNRDIPFQKQNRYLKIPKTKIYINFSRLILILCLFGFPVLFALSALKCNIQIQLGLAVLIFILQCILY
ncbi:Hypothetical_protein [Hexamita inflata]|uniref:Hypothetical_protein n=1 Tax=Hexamita inflata TaxID=28002 RepID=A0AA86RT89_9EUKA|nr:Hypothetical protein HINF_LOCUS65332 [Hexamita inflata]